MDGIFSENLKKAVESWSQALNLPRWHLVQRVTARERSPL